MSEAVVDKFKDTERWRRFVDGTSTRVPDEERDRTLAEMGYSSVEEFIAAEKERRSRKHPWREAKDRELAEKERIEKELDECMQKSAQPLEEWADELLPKEFIKADFSHIISALINAKHWIFSKLSEAQSEGVYEIMLEIMTQRKWSVRDVAKKISEENPVLSDKEAETIARTETAHIVNISRELDYKARDPENKYRYTWVGPSDHRTTPICEAIKARVPREGLPIDELKTVVTEEAQKYYASKGYDTQVREWLPHINCRHHVRRVL